ncbi:MAG: lysophospholipase L1-like esterase [Rubritalea sp.]|jgi:lysophospholipase L1-like esterase
MIRALLLTILSSSLLHAQKDELPKVLILGDSISIGYTPYVQQMLKNEAKVLRPMQQNGKHPQNCSYTANGVKRIDAWLGDTKWDVIHFNFGLHDLKYIGQALPNAKIAPHKGAAIKKNPEARQLSTIEDYLANLGKIVARLKKTNAKLIFCTTTPVPEGSTGRISGDELKYNAAAIKLMKKLDVSVNDLHSYASQKKVAALQRKADVHYSKEGSELLAEAVVSSLRSSLKSK